jgi:hypothetical protein
VGSFTLVVKGHRTATAPGLVQVVGLPLHVGALIKLQGKTAKGEYIVLNCMVGIKEYLIRLSTIKARTGGSITISLKQGRPVAALRRIQANVRVTLVAPKR